jgi:hypothetical protein
MRCIMWQKTRLSNYQCGGVSWIVCQWTHKSNRCRKIHQLLMIIKFLTVRHFLHFKIKWTLLKLTEMMWIFFGLATQKNYLNMIDNDLVGKIFIVFRKLLTKFFLFQFFSVIWLRLMCGKFDGIYAGQSSLLNRLTYWNFLLQFYILHIIVYNLYWGVQCLIY